MDSASVDLIYLDPPFNKKTMWSAPIGSEAAGAAFKDTWTLNDIDIAELGIMAEKNPVLADLIDAIGRVNGNADKSYLLMMAPRLVEMHRVLKSDGSIYLHCDPTMSHSLKLVMDAIFGGNRYRNEIVWERTSGRSDAKGFGKVHDTILYYTKSSTRIFNKQYLPYTLEYIEKHYKYKDSLGRFTYAGLTAPGTRDGESGEPWRGIEPTPKGRHWATPTVSGMNDFIREKNLIPGWPEAYRTVQDRLDALDKYGLVYWGKDGNSQPSLKCYLAARKGIAINDVFVDINPADISERTKYPTQKPMKLLHRIIKSSSNEGDVVLDPFCGCATACVAAHELNRNWIGIDLSKEAFRLVKRRFRNELGLWNPVIIHRTDIPIRSDGIKISKNIKQTRYGEQQGNCKGCNHHFPYHGLTKDHIVPVSKGGPNDDSNIQLLCNSCNSVKGDRDMAFLISQLRKNGTIGQNTRRS